MMDILIIDDEKKARETIAEMINIYCEGEQKIREADGVSSGIRSIQEKVPDLLLLDIHLKDGNGFDILNKIKDKTLNVVFITAYEEYAMKACKVSALDYLLKPVDPDELIAAVEKARERINQDKLVDRLDAFMENMSGSKKLRKMILKTAESIHIVNINDIVFCEASGNYTTFHLVDGKKILVSKPLGEYEEMISDERFIRVHQSFLVNLDHISRYEKGDGGFIITVNNDSIPVSTRKKEQLMQLLNSL
jgi:two-component system LytT family response regulator